MTRRAAAALDTSTGLLFAPAVLEYTPPAPPSGERATVYRVRLRSAPAGDLGRWPLGIPEQVVSHDDAATARVIERLRQGGSKGPREVRPATPTDAAAKARPTTETGPREFRCIEGCGRAMPRRGMACEGGCRRR